MTADKGRRYVDGWQSQAVSADPSDANSVMPEAATSPSDSVASQIVFIDGSVPDAQVLADGVAPGVVAVLLDPNQDGVQQIADYLTSHDVHDVAAIDIVAHGADGMIQLGNMLLGAATIADYQTQLAQIGDALKPGGAIQLYGCDVAQDAGGIAFLQQLSQATGGANIAASSHDVGAAADGGSWTLNVDVGTVDVAAPFTPATLAAYPDVLGVGISGANQIFFSAWNGLLNDPGNRVEQIGVSGSTLVSGNTFDLADASKVADSGLTATSSGIAVDTALNEYFVAVDQATAGTHTTIQEGSITGGGGLSTLYTDPFPNFDAFNGVIPVVAALGGLALDAQHGELYFAQDAEDTNGNPVAADTGIFRLSISGGSATLVTSTGAGLTNPQYLVLDTADNLVFFDDSILAVPGLFPAVDNLDVANLTTGAVTVLHSFFNSSDATSLLQGLAINPTTKTLYLATADFQTASSADNAILSISFSVTGSGSTAAAKIGTIGTLYSGSSAFQPNNVAVDPANNILYVAGHGTGSVAGIYEGSLSGGSLTNVVSMSSLVSAGSASDTTAPELVLVTAPVMTTSGTVTAITNNGAVLLDPGATVSDADGQLIASATITIAGDQTGDTLTFNNGNTFTFADGDKVSSSFSTGSLTLSGNATTGDYQSALDAVTFSTSSNNATTRTIDWTVSDGIVASTTTNSTVQVHVLPTITAGATTTFDGGGPAVALDSGLIITDPSSATLAGATVTIGGFVSGDTLTVGSAGGLGTGFNNGTLTLSGSASLSTYQTALESVQYAFNPNDGDPTGGGSHTSRTITWAANDGTTSGSASSTLNVIHVAPTVTAGASVIYSENGAPVVLDSGLTVSDPDSGSMLAGATVSVGGTFLSGDTLGFLSQNGITGSYAATTGILTLSGSATIADYETALQSITYSFTGDPTNGGTDTGRTISWVVNDGAADSSAATSSVATLCFCAGTRIATPDGEVPVERLAIGDLVLTLDGRAEPIRWIGTGQSLLAPGRRSESTPVIVRAHALEYGVPQRDLRITKGHSLYLEGVLIPVENLINYRTILWDDEARSVIVYHLELDTHEVLLADGAPAESYRDDGNRRQFQNVNPGWDVREAPEPFAPIMTNGPVVADIWRRLLQRTEPCAPIPLTGEPDIHLLVDGERVTPCDIVDGCHVFEAIAGSDVRIASRSAIPAELGENQDQRQLGIAVRRIVLYQCGLRLEIDPASPVFAEGFYDYEAADGFRWTDGAGRLRLSLLDEFVAGEPVGIELHVGCTARYRAPATKPALAFAA
jgi:hypothetical protein